MITVSCEYCGKKFQVYPSTIKRGRGKYCSRSCMGKAFSHRLKNKEFEERFGPQRAREIKKKIKQRKTRINPPSKEELEYIYWKKGLSINEIAGRMNCCHDTVFRWMKKYNIPRREKAEVWEKNEIIYLRQSYWDSPKKEIFKNLPDRTWSGIKSKASRLEVHRNPSVYRSQKPTKPEKKIIKIIQKHELPFKYTGNGKVKVGNMYPDFTSTDGTKKIIEVFGRAFHDPNEAVFDVTWDRQYFGRMAYYSQLGFNCLILWDNELSNKKEVIDKILRFING